MEAKEKTAIEQAIRAAVTTCVRESGWANLAEVGTQLRKMGIKYGKLSRFLDDYPHLVEKKIDESVTPPVVYTRLIPPAEE